MWSLLPAVALATSPLFEPARVIHTEPTGWSAYQGVAAADLDGDGDLDVIASIAVATAWFENLGGGTFGPPQILTTSESRIAVADIDGDGDPDIADHFGTWLENQGGGSFAPHLVDPAKGRIADMWVDLADLDGDGDIDALFAEYFSPPIHYFENNGGGVFGPRVEVPYVDGKEPWGYAVATGDIDGDGDLDVVTSIDGFYGGGGLNWNENLGGGTLGPPQAVDRYWTSTLDIADIDGDGDADVLECGGWHENLGAGTFAGENALNGALGTCAHIVAADLDGDGDPDLVSGPGEGPVGWYENLGGGAFGPEQALSAGDLQKGAVATADVDGDGCVDVLSVTHGPQVEVAWYRNARSSCEPPPEDTAPDTGGDTGTPGTVTDTSAGADTADTADTGTGSAHVVEESGCGCRAPGSSPWWGAALFLRRR